MSSRLQHKLFDKFILQCRLAWKYIGKQVPYFFEIKNLDEEGLMSSKNDNSVLLFESAEQFLKSPKISRLLLPMKEFSNAPAEYLREMLQFFSVLSRSDESSLS